MVNPKERSEAPKEELSQNTPILEVDLSKVGHLDEEVDTIRKALKRKGIYRADLLYRGFDGNRIDIALKHGTDVPWRDFTFASTEKELLDEDGDMGAISHAGSYEKSAILVYDGRFMEPKGYPCEFLQGVNPLDALRAILVLNYNRK